MKRLLRLSSLVLVLVVGLLAGCNDALNLYERTIWGADCRPEMLHDGRCVAAK